MFIKLRDIGSCDFIYDSHHRHEQGPSHVTVVTVTP